jgi:hypothetical protein
MENNNINGNNYGLNNKHLLSAFFLLSSPVIPCRPHTMKTTTTTTTMENHPQPQDY